MNVESRRIHLITLVGIAVSVGFVWLAFGKLEFAGIAEAFRSAKLWPWIPLAMLSYIVGQGIRGLRLRRLVSHDADLPLGTATNIVVLGYAVNNILPARMGELARAALLRDRTGMPFAQSLTVTLLERILDGWTVLLLFFASTLIAPKLDITLIRTAWIAAAIFGAASVGIFVMLFFPYGIASFASRLVGRIVPAWRERVWRLCIYVSNGLAYLKRPGDAFGLFALSVAVWMFEAVMFLMVLPAFGLPMRLDWAVLAMAVTNLGILVPSTPGYVGPFHYFCMQTLVLLGVATLTATSYAITVHAVFYVPITIWGIGVLMRYGIELGGMISMARDAKQQTETTLIDDVPMIVLGTRRLPASSDEPGQLIVAITEALLPGPQEGYPDAPPERVERVATFVQGQIDALPAMLRMLLFIGLSGFRFLVRLRYAASFCALPLETRRRVVNFWAYGPYALTRALFRVLRSTVLLRYYEDSDLEEADA